MTTHNDRRAAVSSMLGVDERDGILGQPSSAAPPASEGREAGGANVKSTASRQKPMSFPSDNSARSNSTGTSNHEDHSDALPKRNTLATSHKAQFTLRKLVSPISHKRQKRPLDDKSRNRRDNGMSSVDRGSQPNYMKPMVRCRSCAGLVVASSTLLSKEEIRPMLNESASVASSQLSSGSPLLQPRSLASWECCLLARSEGRCAAKR